MSEKAEEAAVVAVAAEAEAVPGVMQAATRGETPAATLRVTQAVSAPVGPQDWRLATRCCRDCWNIRSL